MYETAIEPLVEAKRWRSRNVRYWAGKWEAVSTLIPRFEIGEFRAEVGAPANPYMSTVVRVPMTLLEQRVPVGVVSSTYTLVQHHDLAERCFEGIRQAGVSPSDLRCEVGLTELGEWMHLRIYFPDDQEFEPAKGDRMKLRMECYNSVEGSCRVVVLLGWLRLVCTNGLIIRETKTELREIHDERLDVQRIPKIICEAMRDVQSDMARMTRWTQTPVTPRALVPWVNKHVSGAWGKKAACRVFHICASGHDVEIVDPFAPGDASEKPVRVTARVPGVPLTAANMFDVSQSMSWVATGRSNTDERLDWQSGLPRLMNQLGQVVARHATG